MKPRIEERQYFYPDYLRHQRVSRRKSMQQKPGINPRLGLVVLAVVAGWAAVVWWLR